MLCAWISILLCLKHRYCFKFGGRKNILLVWWQFSVWELWGEKVFVYLRALRRKCICIWELCGENVQRQAADLAELTPSPGEGRRGEGGEEEKGGECWSYWCVPLLICRLLDYSQVLVAMILRASRKCRVCWFPDVTVDLWPSTCACIKWRILQLMQEHVEV